jgi:recombination protein RecT
MAGPITKPTGEIVRKQPQRADLAVMLEKMKPEIARAVPKHVNPERMVRIALTSLRMNPDLMKCSPGSFLGCVMAASQLGLEIGGPRALAYLIPSKDECTLIVSYRGMMSLARRSGMVSAIYAYDVREGDTFSYALGLNPTLDHKPSEDPGREAKKMTHVYAVAKLKDGEPIFVVLTKAQVDTYRNRSRAKNSGPWVTDPVAMALKTAVRRLFTWLPQSSEMSTAAALDEAPELGQRQSTAFDPTITDALQAHGIETTASAADEPEETAAQGETTDPETGEVTGGEAATAAAAATPQEQQPAPKVEKPAKATREPGVD